MPQPRLRVLVVDDIADARLALRLLLKLWGHEVAEAADGPGALRAAEAFRPDVVLLDISMPGMSGHEVARCLRERGLRPSLLVAVTGYGREADVRAAMDAGFDHH